MNKKSFLVNLLIVTLLTCVMNVGCKKSEDPSPSSVPVERMHFDEKSMQSLKFENGESVEYKLLLDKSEIVTVLFFLNKNQTIPAHFHNLNKAIYIYEGEAEVFVANQMTPVRKGDSLYIPQGSVTSLKNTKDEPTQIFFFFPKGLFNSLPFLSPNDKVADNKGEKIQLLKEENVPWENWDGLMPLGSKPTPLAWKTIINNESMVMGITKIDPDHDVDSHHHKPTQIVIFSDGEGKTHILNGEYKEIRKNSYIYPPTYSTHHSINTSKTQPLMEVYFFPTGPFSTIKYLGLPKKNK